MSLADKDPIRIIADRVFRESLKHTENLREFLEQAAPQYAGRFVCAVMV